MRDRRLPSGEAEAYLLVDQVLILRLDTESVLDALETCPFLENGPIHEKQFPLHHLALIRKKDQLAAILKLSS
jgi:hypothetical protein